MEFSLIKTQSSTFFHNPTQQNSSDHVFPIFLIVLLSILVTAFSLISYFTFLTKCCSNLHQFSPLRWISSILRSSTQHNEDPFISLFSPTAAWNQGGGGGGLDESAIREIPAFQFTITGETIVDQSVYCCMVCLTEFKEHDMLKILPNCSHVFHLDCIDIWLQSNSNCPLCRSRISGDTHFPFNQIIAPSSSPQDSQILSNMDSDEDFVVIELGGGDQHYQERNDTRERSISENLNHSHQKIIGNLKQRKFFHKYSIMGDECIDVREKDEEFFVQPIRRSFSMDSANDRQVYLDVQAIIQQQKRHIQNEASGSEDCNGKGRRSFFPFCYGKGIKNYVLPLENYV